MKKLIVLMLTVSMVTAIIGCGSSTAPEAKTETSEVKETQAPASVTEEAEKTETPTPSAPAEEEPEETETLISSAPEEEEPEETETSSPTPEAEETEEPEKEEAAEAEEEVKDSSASEPAATEPDDTAEYPDVTVVNDNQVILGPNNEYMIITNIDFSDCKMEGRYFTGELRFTSTTKQAYVDTFNEYLFRQIVFGLYDADGNLRGEKYTQNNYIYEREYTSDEWTYVMESANADIVDVRVEKIIIDKPEE